VHRLKRAQSLHPDKQIYLRGPEFKYAPLEFDYDPESYRTVAHYSNHLVKRPYYLPGDDPKRIGSSDHLSKLFLNGSNSDDFVPHDSFLHAEIRAERVPAEDIDREERSTNVSEIIFDPDSLCEKCRGVNVESMAVDGGYVHLTLDVIRAQGKTCRLCEALPSLYCFNTGFNKLNYDRCQLSLSLKDGVMNASNSGFFVNDSSSKMPRRFVSVNFVDSRSGEGFPSGRDIPCFTDKDGPARAKSIQWLRSIGDKHSFCVLLQHRRGLA
jgi:hypothetical protein